MLVEHCTINAIPLALRKKATIHKVTTMLATSKKSYFQIIITCKPPVLHDDLTLVIAGVPVDEGSSVPVISR